MTFDDFVAMRGAPLERVQLVQLHLSIFQKPHLHPSIFHKLSEKKGNGKVFPMVPNGTQWFPFVNSAQKLVPKGQGSME